MPSGAAGSGAIFASACEAKTVNGGRETTDVAPSKGMWSGDQPLSCLWERELWEINPIARWRRRNMLGGRLRAVAEEKGDWSLSPGLERDEVGDMRDEFVGTPATSRRCSRKISNRSPHTVTWAVFSSASSGAAPPFQATAGGCKKRDGKEDAPEGEWSRKRSVHGISFRCVSWDQSSLEALRPGMREDEQGVMAAKGHPCRSRCSLMATRAGKCLNTEDAPTEREGKTSGVGRMGVAITGKSRGDRYGRANHHHVESEDTWATCCTIFPFACVYHAK